MDSRVLCRMVREDATFTTLGAAFSAMSAMEADEWPVSAYANAGCGKMVRFGELAIAAGDDGVAAADEIVRSAP
jgi:hypothetical protein